METIKLITSDNWENSERPNKNLQIFNDFNTGSGDLLTYISGNREITTYNDTMLKNLKKIYRFLMAKNKFQTISTKTSENREISSEDL